MSYYIRAPKNRTKWYVWEEKWTDGKKHRVAVPTNALYELGFSPSMSVDEAKQRASQLNKQRSLDKKKFTQAARNLKQIELIKSTFLPQDLVGAFETFLHDSSFASSEHQNKLGSHWKFVQKVIQEIQIDPDNFWNHRQIIYKYFLQRQLSLDYSKKLLRVLNLWGQFVSEKRGRFYRMVPNPKGIEAVKISEAQAKAPGRRGASCALTPLLLQNMESKLKTLPGQYEWMFVSLWFGLRPAEVDQLSDSRKFRIEHDPEYDIDVLVVYQPKLVAISKDKRWKYIPVIFEEQKRALLFIRSGCLKKPLGKTIQKYSNVSNLTRYGGRKGFTDLMLSLGQKLEDIAMWLGHRNVETTWKHYKQRDRISFTKPKAS